MSRAHADLQTRQDLGDLLPVHKLAQKVWLRDNKICFTVWDKEKEEERKLIRRLSSEKPDNEEVHSNTTTRLTLRERVAKNTRMEEPLDSDMTPDPKSPNTKASFKERSREAIPGDEEALDRKALREWWITEKGIWLDL